MDDASVSVPVLVQPDSQQACLMGTNVICIQVVRSTGKPVLPSVVEDLDIVVISLVESVTLPSHKGRVVKGVVLSPDHVRTDLFEPNCDVMDSLEASVVTPS
jgi:hypothetical protein